VALPPEIPAGSGYTDSIESGWKMPMHRATSTQKTIPRNAHPLVKIVFAGMIEQGVTYVEMAELAGFSRESLTAWRVRYTPDFKNIKAALGVLGLHLQAVDASGQPYAPQIVLRNSRNGHGISVPPHAAPIVQLVFAAMAEKRITYEVLGRIDIQDSQMA
jgi:hypothetical protein